MRLKDYYEAYLEDYHRVVVYMNRLSYEGNSKYFYMRDAKGTIIDLPIQTIETLPNNYNKYTLKLQDEIIMGNEYEVVHEHARATVLQYSGIVKTMRFDDEFYYDGNDLGYTYSIEETSFALWAPTAYRVKLEITKNEITHTYDMQRRERGVFRYCVHEDLENALYKFFVRVNGRWTETIDPYGYASCENSRYSAIVNLAKIKVKDYPLPTMHSYCDAIIYEASVRDFTIQRGCGVTNAGRFLGFVEENETTKAKQTGFSYLKSLGITHVQLLPVMDFGSVDEMYPQRHYNWGYDPVQYRTPEGSLCADPYNPYERLLEFTSLIERCHKEGIRINLDVVFNHVYDKNTSSLDCVVPDYYFQMNDNGEFSNGTFCGNDIDSTRKMCSKFIIDTCVYLTKTYHIDGLRFDLMGILDYATINAVYEKCRAINSNFMVYGEGWNMPSFLDMERRASLNNQYQMPHIAQFSDRFRDVVKGRTSTHEANIKGYCTGDTYLIDIMRDCLSASCLGQGIEPLFSNPSNAINYVECHDNMTAWDKMHECCKEDVREIRIQRQIMLNAAVLLAQGVPFLHSGQEFARTKHGHANTYNASDEINHIDYARKDRYQQLVESTKALIQLRRKYKCFRYASKQEIEKYVSFVNLEGQVLLYHIYDTVDDMVVVFNPTGNTLEYDFHIPYQLLFYNEQSEDILIQKLTIKPYSTIVLHR